MSSNAWSAAPRRTISSTNSWYGTGKLCARLRKLRHDKTKAAKGARGAQTRKDDGRLHDVLREARTLAEHAGPIGDAASPKGDLAFHARRRRRRRCRGPSLDASRRLGVSAAGRRSGRFQSRYGGVLGDRGHTDAAQCDLRNAIDAVGELRAAFRANGSWRNRHTALVHGLLHRHEASGDGLVKIALAECGRARPAAANSFQLCRRRRQASYRFLTARSG